MKIDMLPRIVSLGIGVDISCLRGQFPAAPSPFTNQGSAVPVSMVAPHQTEEKDLEQRQFAIASVLLLSSLL